MDDKADRTEDHADDNESAERRLIAVLREYKKDGGEKREARTEIGRNLPLAEDKVEQRADTIEQQYGRGVDVKEDRHEHRRAEHREEMLQGEGDGGQERRSFCRIDRLL